MVELKDEWVAAFASPIEYTEGDKDIIYAENEESRIGIIPILVACKALYLTAFSVCSGNATDGYDLFVGYHLLLNLFYFLLCYVYDICFHCVTHLLEQ